MVDFWDKWEIGGDENNYTAKNWKEAYLSILLTSCGRISNSFPISPNFTYLYPKLII